MILDQQAIEKLRGQGVEVKRLDGKPIPDKTPKKKLERNYLLEIRNLLETALARPVAPVVVPKIDPPSVTVAPPNVTVQPPEVVVNIPPSPKRVTQWKFTLRKDGYGQTTEIIAVAMD